MVLPLALRTSLLLATLGLAACSSLPRSITVREGEPTTFSLVSRRGPKLTLQNASSGKTQDIYGKANDQLRKVVSDAELQALLDVFTAEKLFEQSVPRLPGNARDVLRLQQGPQSWMWARRGSFNDPREAAFNEARGYFLSLYNGSTAYHTGPSSDDGAYPTFLTEQELQRRDAELQRLRDEKAKAKAVREGGRRDGR